MPNQILPITGLAEIGLIEDTPSVALPPNAFSDVKNVRFRNGAIRKFPGETTSNLLPAFTGQDIVYAASWNAPTGTKYVIVRQDAGAAEADVHIYNDVWTELISFVDVMPCVYADAEWQHAEFNGGFHFILNNGTDTPYFIQEDVTASSFVFDELPGWDSYAVDTTVTDFTYNGTVAQVIPIYANLAANSKIKVTSLPRSPSDPILTETVTVNATVDGVLPDGTLLDIGTIANVTATGFDFTPQANTGGTRYVISITSDPVTSVTAKVIRAYGNTLVAGNLEDTERTLTGTIRTSDVAAPGEIPQNWNPFTLGVNTADEFTLSTTGIVQDMKELQGVLYIYTDRSIHALRATGNPDLPFSAGTVTDSYGADGIDTVIDADGKHIVVGSDDVYIFAGHPGSITSIASGRVRNNFRNNKDYKVVRFNKWDELWFWKQGTAEMYIYNYRANLWTKRSGSVPVCLNSAPGDLILATATEIKNVDEAANLNDSYVERRRMSLTPEFDTEAIQSMAIIVDGSGTLNITAVDTDAPGDVSAALINQGDFDIAQDYKHDIRVTGRFFNYRIAHVGTTDMNLSGIQLDINKGGRR